MSTSTRRNLGVTLIVVSVLSGFIIPMVTGDVGPLIKHEGEWLGSYYTVTICSNMPLYWLLPLVALFCAGIACVAWPSRKPPRLTP